MHHWKTVTISPKGQLVREWAWIGNPHLTFSLKPQHLCLLEPKATRNSIHTHTNKIKHSTLIKNIAELIMVVMKEKSNFTEKMMMKKLHMFWIYYHLNQNFKGEKNRVNILIKKHIVFTSKFKLLFLTRRNIN